MWWVFELIIFFYLIVVGAFMIEIGTQWKRFNKKTGVLVIAGILAVGWVAIFYGSFIEPRTLTVDEQHIQIADDPTDEIRVVVMGDIHTGPYRTERWAAEVTEKIMQQNPEMIVLPGDFIFSDPRQAEMLEPLSRLYAPLGVYAVTGNHDYEADGIVQVIDALEGFGIEVLENEVERIQVGDRELVLAGVSDLWYEGDVHSTLADVSDEESVILLSHNPDAVLFSHSDRADLVVSGHTHGGQIRLPWIGSLAPLPTMLGNEYDKGLFDYKDGQLFITAGVGETGPRARLFNPPEINVLTISF
jgi:uncharacterized protein